MKTLKNIAIVVWTIALLVVVMVGPSIVEDMSLFLGLIVVALAMTVLYELGVVLGILNQIKIDR